MVAAGGAGRDGRTCTAFSIDRRKSPSVSLNVTIPAFVSMFLIHLFACVHRATHRQAIDASW